MKFFAYIVKGGKELTQFSILLFSCRAIELFVVYFMYESAVNAHIPLKNFNEFMKNGYTLIATIAFSSLVVFGFFYVQIYKNKYMISLALISCFYCVVGVIKGITFNLTMTGYDQEGNQVISCLVISFVACICCVVANRIIGNYFFRELFSKEFQERCETGIDEDNPIYNIQWIRKSASFLKRHLRNFQFTTVSKKMSEQGIRESNEYAITSDCKEEPTTIEFFEPKKTLRFKRVPYVFTFQPQAFIECTEDLQGTIVLPKETKNLE